MVKGIKQLQITKLTAEDLLHQEDSLAVEEPLEIKIEFGPDSQRETRNLAITMRTPGADFLLASGFLFTEGIIHSYSEIRDITHCGGLKSKLKGTSNSVKISLQPTVELDFNKLSRHFYTTSSCGVCGKASIDLLETAIKYPPIPNQPVFNSSILYSLPGILRNNQSVFENTGGIHAAGLFDSNGTLIDLQEDVGRHNA
ncbi:MAG: formate dehydrogenase accessory sulfurtransferase FdhD, partial [Cyclobacteriaceae bacterium]